MHNHILSYIQYVSTPIMAWKIQGRCLLLIDKLMIFNFDETRRKSIQMCVYHRLHPKRKPYVWFIFHQLTRWLLRDRWPTYTSSDLSSQLGQSRTTTIARDDHLCFMTWKSTLLVEDEYHGNDEQYVLEIHICSTSTLTMVAKGWRGRWLVKDDTMVE